MIHRHPITHAATALTLAACAALASPAANAALVARSLDGDATTAEAYHDTGRGITWLRDASALADAYGLAPTMSYAAATAALASFNADPTLNYGHVGWRLPDAAGVHLVGGAGCQFGTNGSTDCGDNVDVASSELAHLFHVLLGNQSWRDTTGAVRPGVAGIDWGLVDTGDFDDLDAVGYWSRTASYRLVLGIAQPGQVVFQMNTGSQTINSPGALNAAWLVHDGDIGTAVVEAPAVPAPGSLALLIPGLLALGLPRVARRRITATLLLSVAGASQAAIIEGADVGPFRTFVDTATGTVWADLDNHLTFNGSGFAFRYADRADYLAALQAAGFTWATTTEVAALTATVPMATTPDFAVLGGVMASLSFDETTTLDGYANVGDGLVQRHYGQPDYGAGTATWAVGGWTPWPPALNDSGLWAYIPGAPGPAPGVPLPGTLALVAAGLGIAARRRGAVRQPAV